MHCERVRRAQPLLGTLVEISLTGADADILHDAANAAFTVIAQIHDLMSFHSADSDISRLNNSQVGKAVTVNPHTWRVIQLAQEISITSAGAFDISVGREMMLRGALPNFSRRNSDHAAAGSGTYRDIELLADNHVRLRRPLAIDVGGIAKGYAVDCAVDVLQRMHVGAGCVNAGGDLRVFGEETVPVQVRDPVRPAMAGAVVNLHNCAFATSANYAGSEGFDSAGIVLDPRNRSKLPDGQSASVRAANCVFADALAKCVLILRQDSDSLLREYKADGFLFGGSGVVVIGGDLNQAEPASPDRAAWQSLRQGDVAMRDNCPIRPVRNGVFT